MIIVLKGYKKCSRQERGCSVFMPRKAGYEEVNGDVQTEEGEKEAVHRQPAKLGALG